jgi:hypothetical protein
MGEIVPSPRIRRHTWRSGATLTAAVLVAVALSCAGIREDEFDCESAVAHLSDCCPQFNAQLIDCTYQAPQACGSPVYPDLGVTQSTCIRNESCETLRSSGVCTRAQSLPLDGLTDDSGVPAPVVCP